VAVNFSLTDHKHFNSHFPGEHALAGFIEAEDDGSAGDNWSYKSCKAPVKSSPPTNQHPTFYKPDAISVAQALKGNHNRFIDLLCTFVSGNKFVKNVVIHILSIVTASYK